MTGKPLVHEPAAGIPVAFRIGEWFTFATALVPLVVWPGFLFPYVTVRGVYLRIVVEIAIACLIYLALRREMNVRLRSDPVLIGLAAFVAANVIAGAFGASPLRSFFGDYERMGGVWTWLHLLGFYVAARFFFTGRDWNRYLAAIVIVAAVVCAIGLAPQSFRRFVWGIGGPEHGIIIGNGGLLAAYLLLATGAASALAFRSRGGVRVLYVALACVSAYVITQTGNRSSTIGLFIGAAVAIAAGVWGAARRGRARPSWRLLAVAGTFAVISLAAIYLARNPTAAPSRYVPSLARFREGVDSARLVQWRAAVAGFRERPALGFGPENYHVVWSRHYQPHMYHLVPDQGWDRAHNAYLDALATSGLVGFAALIALLGAVFATPIRAVRSGGLSMGTGAVLLGVFSAYAAYLFFWFFDVTGVTVWLALAGFAVSARAGPLAVLGSVRPKRWQTTFVLGIGAVALVAALYVYAYEAVRVARALSRMEDVDRPMPRVLDDFETVFRSPAPSSVHAILLYGRYLRRLLPDFAEIRRDPARSGLVDRAFRGAFAAVDEEIRRDALNERLVIERGRMALLASSYYRDPRFSALALREFERAIALAPRRVPSRLIYGNALVTAGMTDRGLAALKDALRLDPKIARTRAFIAVAYAARGDHELAAAWIRDAMERGFLPDPSVIAEILRVLHTPRRDDLVAEVGGDYLRRRYGPFFFWQAHGPAREPVASDVEILDMTERAMLTASPAERPALRALRDALCSARLPLGTVASVAFRSGQIGTAVMCSPWLG